MKKADAKLAVLTEWRSWSAEREISPGDPMIFYNWLRQNMPHLLAFKHSGDQYQVVAGWVANDPMNKLKGR